MSSKQLAKCCLYYKQEVLYVIFVINWTELWARSLLCWWLTVYRRWRLKSQILSRTHLSKGERGRKSVRKAAFTKPNLSLPPDFNSVSSDEVWWWQEATWLAGGGTPCMVPSSCCNRLLFTGFHLSEVQLLCWGYFHNHSTSWPVFLFIYFFFPSCTIFKLLLMVPAEQNPHPRGAADLLWGPLHWAK